MSKKYNNLKADLYRVIGADDSIYLSREKKYLKHGEELELTPQEVELLVGAGLVEKVSVPEKLEEEIKEN